MAHNSCATSRRIGCNGFQVYRSDRVLSVVLLSLTPFLWSATAAGQELSPREQQVLEEMDQAFAAKVVGLLAQVQKWRETIATAKATAEMMNGTDRSMVSYW